VDLHRRKGGTGPGAYAVLLEFACQLSQAHSLPKLSHLRNQYLLDWLFDEHCGPALAFDAVSIWCITSGVAAAVFLPDDDFLLRAKSSDGTLPRFAVDTSKKAWIGSPAAEPGNPPSYRCLRARCIMQEGRKMSETRKLAAILAADVVGYSRLAGADEDRILARLRALRSDLIDPTIAVHNGRVVKRTGDGALVEFRSVVDAVRCAIEIQNAMVERNAGLAPERRIEFRVGIHLGDIVEESDGDLMGDGVNIASRLEGVATPGAICLSEDAYRQVRARLDLAVSDLGDTRLKNIAEPMRVYSLQVGGAAQAKPVAQLHPAAPEKPSVEDVLPDNPSVAVLPFTNMSGDPEQDYFADGMVEDIITGLSRIKWLFVIARNSSFAYKGKAVDVKQAGRELGVRYILEGSVRKMANRVRVTGQLVEAETGRHVWANRYDRILDDVFAIQDELTMSVVAAIEPSLRQAEIERVRRKRPDNLDAYDLVLRAIPHVYPSMPDGAAKALPLLERALEMEPDYALAHGFAAWCHEILFARGGLKEENRLGSIRHAHAAIVHGRDDAIALSLGGFCMGLVAHDREAARQALDAALALSPSCALTFILGSVVMVYDGDADRGIEWGERALRLSPFDPMSYAPWVSITLGRFQRGEYQAAAEAAQKVFQANPYWSMAHVLLAATHAKLGRLDAAKSAARRVLELQPGYTLSGFFAAFEMQNSLATPLSEALAVAGLPA
jgi:TolB-like protein/class 3 adenylate cyclase/tetratricopeptide (TPR) repeat protein